MTNLSVCLTFGEPIKDGHVGNYFCDIFVPLCHVSFFINGNGWKLTDEFVAFFFYFWGLKFDFSSFGDEFVSVLYIQRQK